MLRIIDIPQATNWRGHCRRRDREGTAGPGDPLTTSNSPTISLRSSTRPATRTAQSAMSFGAPG